MRSASYCYTEVNVEVDVAGKGEESQRQEDAQRCARFACFFVSASKLGQLARPSDA